MTPQVHDRRGQHATVGKSDTVWLVEGIEGSYAYMSRYNPLARKRGQYMYRGFLTTRVNVVGEHTARSDPREMPQNCPECGCFREVVLSVAERVS